MHRRFGNLQPQEADMITRRSFTWGTAIAGFGLAAGAARAQDFPARPVTLIVAVQAGTSADACLRALAAATEKHLGRPIIIENRAGASTTLAAQVAARASADGYTLVQIGQTI